MTKPTKWLCAQRRLRSAWASAQSDQSLRCMLNGKLRTQAFFMRTAKTLIRLGGCPGWSESSLGAHSFCWFCHEAALITTLFLLQCQVFLLQFPFLSSYDPSLYKCMWRAMICVSGFSARPSSIHTPVIIYLVVKYMHEIKILCLYFYIF